MFVLVDGFLDQAQTQNIRVKTDVFSDVGADGCNVMQSG